MGFSIFARSSFAVAVLATIGVPQPSAAARIALPAFVSLPVQLVAADPLVQRAQAALAQRGFNVGPADGVLGPRTRAALETYQRRVGLPVTGKVDSALVAQLERIGSVQSDRVPGATRAARAGVPRLTQSELIQQTQLELRRHGYDLTFAGGRLNGETNDAIRDYQRSRGIEPTGAPSDELLTMLRQDRTRVGSRAVKPQQPAPAAGPR